MHMQPLSASLELLDVQNLISYYNLPSSQMKLNAFSCLNTAAIVSMAVIGIGVPLISQALVSRASNRVARGTQLTIASFLTKGVLINSL